MGLRFLRESQYARYFTPDPAIATALTALVLEHGAGFVAVVDGRVVGMLGAVCNPWLTIGPPMASEVCWWLEPELRGTLAGGRLAIGLLQAFEAWAATQGAQVVQMVAPNVDVASLYERRDYERAETAYVKRLAA